VHDQAGWMMMARCKEQRASDLPVGRALENPVQYRSKIFRFTAW
jgi:hypothetical protein